MKILGHTRAFSFRKVTLGAVTALIGLGTIGAMVIKLKLVRTRVIHNLIEQRLMVKVHQRNRGLKQLQLNRK